MQILLLFFHLVNITGKAHFLREHHYADKSFNRFVSAGISKSNLTLLIVARKYVICSRRMTTRADSLLDIVSMF